MSSTNPAPPPPALASSAPIGINADQNQSKSCDRGWLTIDAIPANNVAISTGIAQLSIMPTTQEACTGPNLAEIFAGLQGAAGSIESRMEKQFMMLRYDCTASLRAAVSASFRDLASWNFHGSSLSHVLQDGGGTLIPLISDIRFTGITLNRQFGLAFKVSASTPPGPARNAAQNSRYAFWSYGKRLMNGGMVALVTQRRGSAPEVRMAVIAEQVHFPKKNEPEEDNSETIDFALSFPDVVDTEWAIQEVFRRDHASHPIRFLLENPVMFISFKPFLHGLQTSDPVQLTSTLFEAINFDPSAGPIPVLHPPPYAVKPGFKWDLTCLMASPAQRLRMAPSSPDSIDLARQSLYSGSTLDPSQADAIISALTTQNSLIQGPPGTGKTYTGVQLLRLFIINHVGPIVVMAQTNHALDNILRAAHDCGVTTSIVRLGARSDDPVLKNLTLQKRELLIGGKSRITNIVRGLRDLEMQMTELVDTMLANSAANATRIQDTLAKRHPHHQAQLISPSSSIQAMLDDQLLEEEQGWSVATEKGMSRAVSLWSFWADGADIQHLAKLRAQAVAGANVLANGLAGLDLGSSEMGHAQDTWAGLFQKGCWDPTLSARTQALSDPHKFILHFALPAIPATSKTDRTYTDLAQDPNVWSYSKSERRRFIQNLADQSRTQMDLLGNAQYQHLITQYEAKRADVAEARRIRQLAALEGVQIVGCTTNGAARLRETIATLSPKVLLVEEAGQALEAHILATLSPSIQHLIQLGDPQQLRCITNCYKLSLESRIGAAHYRLNESMMERVHAAGYPMTQLLTQRRMRPQISALIRSQIYPNLKDDQRVKVYPKVQGSTKDVFFFDHRHEETADGQGGQKKANPWEARMVSELALHFAKQGCYPAEKGVVILCAYAGQVMEVKKCLEGRAEIKTGEKEKEALARAGGNNDIFGHSIRPSKLTVMVRTIDSFQGEEADIIILSLVRNAGETESPEKHSIGFLKINNRTNVAISRAKHGLFILGNAAQLASQSDFWTDSLHQLDDEGCVGDVLPLGCAVHGTVHEIIEVEDFEKLAPNGGCTLLCAILPIGSTSAASARSRVDDRATAATHVPAHVAKAVGHARLSSVLTPWAAGTSGMSHAMSWDVWAVSSARSWFKFPARASSKDAPPVCREPCGVECDACGQTCSATCLTCQRLSKPLRAGIDVISQNGLATPPPDIIQRTKHAEHQCRPDMDKVLAKLGPLVLDLANLDIRIVTSLAAVVLPAPDRHPNERALARLLSFDKYRPETVKPISSGTFGAGLQSLFCFTPSVRSAWLQVVGPILERHVHLEAFFSPSVITIETTVSRIRAILHAVGYRLILALCAGQYTLALRRNASSALDAGVNANFVAHLFDILRWTVLRSCERDLKLAEYSAERPGLPTVARIAVAGAQIVLEQWTVLITLHGLLYGAHPDAELAKEAMVKAERKSRGIVEGVKRASRAGGDERVSARMEELDRTLGRWMQIKEVSSSADVETALQGSLKDLTDFADWAMA
ncbi:uncharacterized protein MKK02DRAFT_29126 [Dioszegia hungarica]|uniref:P-loop containing nucleoside triphosphate hydrolase protein n=1 Tax=Dioszegia hungarica TaxID=4972 RepID=A0AA38LU02_9TREE|nr:uncharacterized protein MKK02DRAFT_29126 [Dioszegia hungarica]KAI9633256.1 hypothetical protein MKK02DRAFT_29126 [Dioszegia hungarica]